MCFLKREQTTKICFKMNAGVSKKNIIKKYKLISEQGTAAEEALRAQNGKVGVCHTEVVWRARVLIRTV